MQSPQFSHHLILALIVTLPIEIARAEDAPPQSLTAAQMAALMHTYVRGEQQASIPFAVSGAATVVAGGLLLHGGSDLERGAAWPLLGVGAIELVSGLVLAVRTGGHEAELSRTLAENAPEFARIERAHVDRIQNLFQPLLLSVEGAILAGGGIMAAVAAQHGSSTVEGVGLGLAVQGLVMFVLDWAVLDRARAYSTSLAEFHPG